MAIYDTEEEQVEALKRWWKENSQAVIIGVIAGAGIIFGNNFWQSHKKEQLLQASDVYQQLLTADQQGNSAEVEKLGQSLSMQYASSPYAVYADLFQAKHKAQQGDLKAAKAALEKVIKDGDATMKNVARIRLLNVMLASGEYEQGLKLIAETDASSIVGFSSSYEELKGDLYVALKRNDEARTAYENALREGAQSPLLQFKLDDLTAAPMKPPAMLDAKVPVPTSETTAAPATPAPAANK